MSESEALPPVDSNEWLARFVYYQRFIRQDRTVRPEAFIPHPYRDLSVTRHLQLSDTEIWKLGETVALQTGRPLYGRADVQALVFLQRELQVVADPILDNPNHAIVTGWPGDKPAQKILAQQIAAAVLNVLESPSKPV